MTIKLYNQDSSIKNFRAQVLVCEKYKQNYTLILDQTAFYPGGGGQPEDSGTINGLKVLGIFEKAGCIYHEMSDPIEVGTRVEGEIDFKRRFDYMQQHSGEHILSGIIHSTYGFNNVGFHLSDQYMTADLDGELTREQLQTIEKGVNQAIYENRVIETEVLEHTQLENKVYRSKIDLVGEVRLVTVPDYDSCACCGTHVRSTGEIGILKIVSAQKYKGGMRLTILCGERALRDYDEKLEVIGQLSAKLSAKPIEIVEAVQRISQELTEIKQLLGVRTQALLVCEAKGYGAMDIVCTQRSDLSGDELRRFCMAVMSQNVKLCIVVSQEDKGLRYVIGSHNQEVRSVCKMINETFKGKGGGNELLCQGTLQTDYPTFYEYWKGLEKNL